MYIVKKQLLIDQNNGTAIEIRDTTGSSLRRLGHNIYCYCTPK